MTDEEDRWRIVVGEGNYPVVSAGGRMRLGDAKRKPSRAMLERRGPREAGGGRRESCVYVDSEVNFYIREG